MRDHARERNADPDPQTGADFDLPCSAAKIEHAWRVAASCPHSSLAKIWYVLGPTLRAFWRTRPPRTSAVGKVACETKRLDANVTYAT